MLLEKNMGMHAYGSSGCEKVGMHKLILVGWRMMVTYVWSSYVLIWLVNGDSTRYQWQ